MTVFAKKLILMASVMFLLVVAFSQMALGVVPGMAILRSIELTFTFWLVVCVVSCIFN